MSRASFAASVRASTWLSSDNGSACSRSSKTIQISGVLSRKQCADNEDMAMNPSAGEQANTRLVDDATLAELVRRLVEPPRGEADSALALAREVYEAVLARLPAEVRPGGALGNRADG